MNLLSHILLFNRIMEQMEMVKERWEFSEKERNDATFQEFEGFIVVTIGSADSPTWDQNDTNMSHNNVRQFGFNRAGTLKWHAHGYWAKRDSMYDMPGTQLSSNRRWALRFTKNHLKGM